MAHELGDELAATFDFVTLVLIVEQMVKVKVDEALEKVLDKLVLENGRHLVQKFVAVNQLFVIVFQRLLDVHPCFDIQDFGKTL